MSSLPPPHGWALPSSSLVDALREDEDIEDVVTLTGAELPEWLQELRVPKNWQLVGLSAVADQSIVRIPACGSLGDGEWEGTGAITVFGYTGWPVFYDVVRSVDRTLRGLNATGIATQVLPVPPIQWTAAVRGSGVVLIGDRSVWLQQSNYVAGSEQPHASRLTVHNIFVDAARRSQLAEEITELSDAVYDGFIATLLNEKRKD